MVPLITMKNEVIGSVIFENPKNNEVRLYWYQSEFKVEESLPSIRNNNAQESGDEKL